jgi:hypothetical protein
VLELALERDDLRDGLRDILATLVEREDLA